MVSKWTNIVLLCAILTNITVIIAVLQLNISLLLFFVSDLKEAAKSRNSAFCHFWCKSVDTKPAVKDWEKRLHTKNTIRSASNQRLQIPQYTLKGVFHPSISIFCCLYGRRPGAHVLLLDAMLKILILSKVSAPVSRGESLGSVLVPGQLRTTCEHKCSL